MNKTVKIGKKNYDTGSFTLDAAICVRLVVLLCRDRKIPISSLAQSTAESALVPI